ncbi:MAG: Mrp/NBP35 family ATP-binding protein [SAR202 cluster bacterium]|nr:Mrp/NBP35 family ATP-binding protein [SAR202 cluster bacterium]
MTHQHQPPQMSEEQRQARLRQIKGQWEQRRRITETLGRIKTKIGVYSGKGGVGKTTVAVNLAAYLAKQGFRVGLLDADIDCPNVAKVIGATEPAHVHEGRIEPAEAHGVSVVSMSFFQEKEDEAIIFRGPMIHNAINQFLQMTEWGDLDFLVVDLPPGTSDAPLTIMQTLTLDGFVIVTTPQSLAALDAKRSINMVRKLNVNVLGIVENMTGDMFGGGAGEQLAKDLGLAFLGQVAMRRDYRTDTKPSVLASKDVLKEYDHIWKGLQARLAEVDALPAVHKH